MISEKMQKALSEQINWELYSSYLYLSMSSHFHSVNLGGFASWMRVQAQEELLHAIKFYDFVHERGGKVLLQPVKAPPSDWNSPLAAFEAVVKHEFVLLAFANMKITYHLATELGQRDPRRPQLQFAGLRPAQGEHLVQQVAHALGGILDAAQQVEEEASANEVVQKLRLIGDAGGGIFMLDRELAQRVFTMPAAAEGKS